MRFFAAKNSSSISVATARQFVAGGDCGLHEKSQKGNRGVVTAKPQKREGVNLKPY